MKLLPILLILSILVSPVVYSTLKTYFYPFQLMRDFKREAIPKAMIQIILNKFGNKKVSELRNIKIVHNEKTNCKYYYIEAFVLDTTTHEKWNNPEAIFLFVIKEQNGNIEYISHQKRNVWDTGKLIPENTDNLLEMSTGVTSATREELGKKRFKTCEKNYCDVKSCYPTASKETMCKPTVIKTKNLLPPMFEIPGEYRNVPNEWQSDRRVNKSKYNCEFMIPEYSNMRHPFETSPFSCKLRYDLDHNPNRAPVIEESKNITTPLKAVNHLSYA